MNKELLFNKIAGLDKWQENFGQGMERRGLDGVSWYDLSINCNSLPSEAHTAVIVTAWMGQLKWLRAVLASYRKAGAFVVLAFDNPFYAWIPLDPSAALRNLPNMQHYILANSVVMKHITYDSNKRNGWFWDVYYAQGILKQFPNIKNIYMTNGDCLIEKPEGMKGIIDLLGDADLMAGQNNGEIIHTADVIFKSEAFHRIFEYMYELMRVPVLGSRSPELMLREAVDTLKLKAKIPPKQPIASDGTVDMYSCFNQDSTWKEILGFRNLFAEYETAGNTGKEMLFLKDYVDDFMDWLYWGGEEKETICQYWRTGDRRYLMQFWDRWEESDYNRLYYPLNYYGKEPIYEK